MDKRTLFASLLALLSGLMPAALSAAGHVKSATAICRVLGDGRKVAAVVLEYDAPVAARSLTPDSYRVEGRRVTRVYANARPERALQGVDGPYVVVEVETAVDLDAQPRQPTAAELELKRERDRLQGGPGLRAGWSTGGDDTYPDDATLYQQADIRTTDGSIYAANGCPIVTTRAITLVADDFRQESFVSPYTGQTLPYNIYLPADYDPAQRYPLVLFIHDAGTASGPVTQTLYQGNGATSWAEPEAQARHRCIVVAPEYPVVTVDDSWNYSHHLDTTIALLEALQRRYAIDGERIYVTGQSMGCMSSIVMMLKRPDLFAGALLVAGKWDPALMGPLDRQNLWIISCEGDLTSNALQGEAVARWREQGSTVAEATWDMTLSRDELSAEADRLRAGGDHLLFTHLTGGSHRATWFVSYGIAGIQEWLFEQRKCAAAASR